MTKGNGKGKTKSKLGLHERRERAFQLMRRGLTNDQIAVEMKVNIKTVRDYRRRYEQGLHDAALTDPGMLRDVLKNTIRALGELDEVRADAWTHLEEKDRKVEFGIECPHCNHEFIAKVKLRLAPNHEQRVKYHAILLRGSETRAKLLGALGIKQDILNAVTEIRTLQAKLLKWLMEHLDEDQREELAAFISEETPGVSEGSPTGTLFDGMPIETQAFESSLVEV